jgi:type IV pilus assembly protein PilN
MIRINLLSVDRERTKRGVLIPAAHRVTIAASLIVIGTFLFIGWWFWSLHQASARVDDDLAKGEREMQQLRSVLAQVQKFESSKAQLQQRVTLIEQLRRGQSGPVHMIDEIGKALPERLWLTDLTQKGDDVVLAGMTTSFTGLSDFVANLETSAWFKKPIDIVDSQVTTDAKTGDIFKFSVKAVFNNPEAPPPPPAPAAGARGRGGVPAKKPAG